jgi:hypothetical protein
MELSGDQIKQLREALQSTFPDRPKLRQFVLEDLNRNLNEIVGGGSLTDIVAELIYFAVAEGRIVELVTAANRRNPGNLKLRSFMESFGLSPLEKDKPNVPSVFPPGHAKIPRNLLCSGLFSLGATVGISLVRFLGIDVLQQLELAAYDFAMRWRPAEIQDKRIGSPI